MTHRYIVRMEAGERTAPVESAAAHVHRATDTGPHGDLLTVELDGDEADALAAEPGVRHVEPDERAEVLGEAAPDDAPEPSVLDKMGLRPLSETAKDKPAEGRETVPWGLAKIGAPELHKRGVTGDGVNVAVIDTGIDDDHPDLDATVGIGYAAVSCGRTSSNGPCSSTANNACNVEWSDDDGHGSHCAGTVGAETNGSGVMGVAPDATVTPYKALSCEGWGYYSDIVECLTRAADTPSTDVISMSLGGPHSQILREAVQYAARQGVLLVAAAGNTGTENDVQAPAQYGDVLAVAATNVRDARASFSSMGPEVDIAAPGVGVLSTIPGGYETYSGTSMACPHVAATAALLLSRGLDAAGARTAILRTAVDSDQRPEEIGAGRLDAAAAVGSVIDNAPAEPEPAPDESAPEPDPAPEDSVDGPDAGVEPAPDSGPGDTLPSGSKRVSVRSTAGEWTRYSIAATEGVTPVETAPNARSDSKRRNVDGWVLGHTDSFSFDGKLTGLKVQGGDAETIVSGAVDAGHSTGQATVERILFGDPDDPSAPVDESTVEEQRAAAADHEREADFEERFVSWLDARYGEDAYKQQHRYPESGRRCDVRLTALEDDPDTSGSEELILAMELENDMTDLIAGCGQALLYAAHEDSASPVVVAPEHVIEQPEVDLLRTQLPVIGFPEPAEEADDTGEDA